MPDSDISDKLSLISGDTRLLELAEKRMNNERLSNEDALFLFDHAGVQFLGVLADEVRRQLNGDVVYYNRNFHVEPTNICVFDCKFCAYSRKVRERGSMETWEYTPGEILDMVRAYDDEAVTEAHIVGGVHPRMGLDYFCDLISSIKAHRPELHVKAFTAVELDYMCKKAGLSYKEGLLKLKNAGQDSLPGGGAEIFDESIRKQICPDKCSSKEWLEIHKTAHGIGMKSNATILYGHIESYEHRINHMYRLRQLQDETGGFNAFIPLKFRNGNNDLGHIRELSVVEDMKMFAISRLYFDNIRHLKAYWPMLGKDVAQMSLAYGVNDIDGTIDDSTKIYSMAGAEEQNPTMTVDEMKHLIGSAGYQAVERDTLYQPVIS